MKLIKKISIILIISIIICSVFPCNSSATLQINSDNDYEFENGTIIKYIGKGGDVEIPSEINGIPVTEIGEGAFEECSDLISVMIPNGVKEIGIYAFNHCSQLKKVSIPDSVTTINDWTFFNCHSLSNISLSKNIEYIGIQAFAGCNFENIIIPVKLKKIDALAFQGCYLLSDIYYKGTENDWKSIKIDDSNKALLNSKKHFNYNDNDEIIKRNKIEQKITILINGFSELTYYMSFLIKGFISNPIDTLEIVSEVLKERF